MSKYQVISSVVAESHRPDDSLYLANVMPSAAVWKLAKFVSDEQFNSGDWSLRRRLRRALPSIDEQDRPH
jgi:hypothetical protein